MLHAAILSTLFAKVASPLPLITQAGNDARRPQLLPVSTKNIVMNGWTEGLAF